ncbi:MAG: hypothetical protein M1497_08620 [Nitrospirae bacterium]|nr:hypothetical protein [Nitrospirota bacterium]
MKHYESALIDPHEVNYLGDRITGWQFGGHDLMVRIYNKSLEVKKSHKEWFHELWEKGGWDVESEIARTEFQLGRGFLQEFGITTFESFEQALGDIFRYLTQEWFTVREPIEDRNKSRWPVTAFWSEVQGALPHSGQTWGLTRARVKEGKAVRLLFQLAGR